MRTHIASYIGANSLEAITEILMQLPEEEFRSRFAKPNRYFPNDVVQLVLAWIEELKGPMGALEVGINSVAPIEVENYPHLKIEDRDLFWRCVRPNKADVGRPHRDSQFWNIYADSKYQSNVPFDYDERWKIWIPLMGCDQDNSLQVIEKSHLVDVPLLSIETPNGPKPDIDGKWLATQKFSKPFKEQNEKCILFHDDLVHAGPPNLGKWARFSAEFTVLLAR